MKKKRLIALTVTLVLFAGVLAGCANPNADASSQQTASPNDQEVVELTFWDENPGTIQTPLYEGLIEEFNSLHDDIHVTYVAIPHDSARDKYFVAVESGTAPDVGSIEMFWLSNLVARDALLPLDAYFDSWDDSEQFLSLYIDLTKNMGNGTLYMIPYTCFIDVLWYRTDWLAETGVPDLSTWDNFFTAVEKMTNKEEGRYGFAMRGANKSTNQLQADLYSYSGITEYFTEDGKCTINDPAHVEFLEKWVSMYGVYTAESDITSGYQEMTAAFDSGAAGMFHHNLGSYFEHVATLGVDKFAAATLPKSIQGYQLMICNDFCGDVIFNTTEHPEEAWELITFLASKKGQSEWNQAIGQMPVRTDVAEEEGLQNIQALRLTAEVLSDPEVRTLILPTELPDYTTIHEQYLEPEFQRLLQGQISAQSFLDDWARMMEEAKAEYDESQGQK